MDQVFSSTGRQKSYDYKWIAVLLIGFVAVRANAQTINVREGPTTRYAIQLDRIAVIVDSGAQKGGTFQKSVDSRGRLYISSGGGAMDRFRGRVLVYDSTGRYIGSFGRYGKGPGEFQAPPLVVEGQGDTLLAFDLDRRVTRVSRDLKIIKTERTEGVFDDPVALGGGGYMAVDGSSLEIVVVSRAGRVVRRFGGPKAPSTWRMPSCGYKSHIWRAVPGQYAIEKWDSLGRRVQVIKRDANWFEPRDGSAPRRSRITRISEDERGNLWVGMIVPRGEYPGQFGDWGRDSESRPANPMWDYVIEVLDPKGGVVLASMKLNAEIIGGLFGDRFWWESVANDQTGDYEVHVFRRRLVPAKPPGR
jgi:hypothetical protein